MKRYFRIFAYCAKVSLLNQLSFPASFFLAVVGKTLRVGILILFFQAIYLYTPFLGGWSFDDILVLSATFLTLEFLVVITFHRNLAYFLPDLLRKGTFDLLLTKPVNTLWYSAFRIIDLMDTVSALPVVALWWVAASRGALAGTPASILLFLLFIAVGYLFFFAFGVLIAATGFWTLAPSGVGRLYENIVRMARYPSSVFHGPARILLLYVFPVVTAISLPAEAIRGEFGWSLIAFFAIFTALLFIAALRVWNIALRHYASASS